MNKARILELIEKMESDTASATELLELDVLYDEFESKPGLLNVNDLQSNLAYRERLFKKINEQTVREVTDAKTKKLGPAPIAILLSAAMIAIVFSVYFINNKLLKPTATYANEIAPGKNGATLTLANGQKIVINDVLAGNIANQSGVKISKTKEGKIIYEVTDQGTGKTEYNILTTTRGEQVQVRLPDGSLVFLNAESSLRYPTSFAKSAKRSVGLTGEGYFEISKNKEHPFSVTTANQQVEVLGTHFNINAYTDEKAVRTTLLEGSVKVALLSTIGSSAYEGKVLKPGQQSAVTNQEIQVVNVDLDETMAWQKGYFSFYDEDITSIMRKVSRWYNIEVEYSGQLPENGFDARITKYSSIKEVLGKLEKTGDVHFKIEGRKVIVSK